ncbi:MAG TPA: sigma-54 dependent transcriptional regulator [Polyangiaceae bacterium]|nr:sigma-54 dependent transcriptional regulator [Polyangiaceae bacterium]
MSPSSSAPSPVLTISVAPPPITQDASAVHVLVVDDEAPLRRSLARVLETRGMTVGVAEGGEQALAYVERSPPDVALVDMMMPGVGGLDLLAQMKAKNAAVEVILMTAFADVDSAVSAMRAGAYHFLTKPFHSNDAVAHAVLRAAEHRRLADRARQLEQVLLSKERFGEIIGDSAKMLEVYRLVEGVAPTSSTVLILGESGTGKELAARAIHQQSPRAKKPFVAVNCGGIPKELVESELFGHVRGAFTGAQTARAGLFETADGGTILLDEVGDLPLAAQVKLLRVLQEGEIKRVGADETRTVDVRVLAATNVDLVSRIQSGQFRRDLYYRLNVIAIELPPLRERGDDVLLLANHYLQKFARSMGREPKRLSADAVRALREYEWPGNVRELEHAIEHAMVLSQKEVIAASDLPFMRHTSSFRDALTRPGLGGPVVGQLSPPEDPVPVNAPNRQIAAEPPVHVLRDFGDLPYPEAKRRLIERFDEAYTQEVLKRARGNTSEAARLAGLDRSNFRRLLKRHKPETGT